LREAGYVEQRVLEALGVTDGLELTEAGPVAHLRTGRMATLAALFLAGSTVSADAATDALGDLGGFERAGVLARDADGVRATVRIEEYGGLLIASDRDDMHPAEDYVLEVGPSTREAASLTVRRPVAQALDACSGSGLHALLLRRHADRVVGTEISPRAVAFARFNAVLNGVDGIDWRLGNLLEPVEGETFGVVVCNPPFVIGPSDEPLYRDGRAPADELSRAVVTGTAQLLDEGGFATVVCNWISNPSEPWYEPPERWLEGCGCDLLLLRLGTDDALDYAASWSSWVLGRDGRDAYVAAVERRREHLREFGAEAVTTGVVVLRRRSGAVWTRRDELSLPPRGSASAQLLRIFEAQDFLGGLRDDRDLLAALLEPAPGVRLVHSARYGEGGYEPRVAQFGVSRSSRSTTGSASTGGSRPRRCRPSSDWTDGGRCARRSVTRRGRRCPLSASSSPAASWSAAPSAAPLLLLRCLLSGVLLLQPAAHLVGGLVGEP